MRFFFFGTLRDRDVLAVVLGHRAPAAQFTPAWLADHRLVKVRRQTYPMLLPAHGAEVQGVVVDGFGPGDLERIAFFESVDYLPVPMPVTTSAGEPIEVHVYRHTERISHAGEPWRFEEWLADHKPAELRAATLWMALFGQVPIEEADRLWEAALTSGQPLEAMVRAVRARRLRMGAGS